MSYSRIGGGELTGVEIAYLTSQIRPDTTGVMNTPLALATVTDAVAGPLASVTDLLKTIDVHIPDWLFGQGMFSFGIMEKTMYPVPVFGPDWDPDLINSTSKHDLARFMLTAILMGAVTAGAAIVAPRAVAGGVKAVPMAMMANLRHREVMAAVEGVDRLESPPQLTSSARTEIALEHLLQGLSKNSRTEMKKGIKILQS